MTRNHNLPPEFLHEVAEVIRLIGHGQRLRIIEYLDLHGESKVSDIVAALEHSIVHKGRAILYNMVIIVAGFVVLMLSEFVPLIQFGGLVSFCMVVTAAGSLVLVPAIIRVLATHGVKFIDLGAKVRPAQAAQPAQEAALPTPPQAGASAAGPTATA